MLKILWNKNKQALARKRFISSIQGIGDVLSFDARRKGKDESVKQGLQRLQETTKTFFAIREKDVDKFNSILFDPDFIILFRENEGEAQARLAFQPERYLVAFSTILNQFRRIHDAAVRANNEEISRFTIYQLVWLLEFLTQKEKVEIFIEQLLRTLNEASSLAIEKSDRSMYSSSTDWYFSSVFEQSLRLEYLPQLDKYLFHAIRTIVAKDQADLFLAFAAALNDRIHGPSHHAGRVRDYIWDLLPYPSLANLISSENIQKTVDELIQSLAAIDSVETLHSWLEKFEAYVRTVKPHIDASKATEADKIESDVREYVTYRLKFNNLLQQAYSIGAYLLFKRKPQFIRILWEYKQPSDSDAVWVGPDITPINPEEAVAVYFNRRTFEWSIWEGHHGTDLYLKKYFLLVVARTLRPLTNDTAKEYPGIQPFLQSLNVHSLRQIEYSIDELLRTVPSVTKDEGLLRELGFEEIHLLFQDKVVPFLEYLKSKGQETLKSLGKSFAVSPAKIDSFKGDFVAAFKRNVVVRQILQHHELFIDRSTEPPPDKLKLFGFSLIEDKAAFFEEWYVSYSDFAQNYGQSLATSEDDALFREMIKAGRKDYTSLDECLGAVVDLRKAFILTSNIQFFTTLERLPGFTPKWARDSRTIEAPGFQGWYGFKHRNIPVFGIDIHSEEKSVLVVDATNAGHLTQYSPLFDEVPLQITDIFHISVRSFSDDERLMESYLEKPQAWLLEQGDPGSQRDYLRGRVLLQIFERFKFIANQSRSIQILSPAVIANSSKSRKL